MVGFLLPLAPRAQADTEVSLNFFYDNLSDQGSWIEVADYGYAFQPSVAVSNSDWRPYADGYWAYTDLGWTWVSYEDFGWATYHYGRWANLDSYGWVWVPGYEWGPAWVSWRTGGDYVGWAPLPPQRSEVVYEGTAITNQVDIQFGIGPLYYNFVDIRYIGEPVLRSRILPPTRNVTIINNTVNVTNITYNNSVVYNYGPDFNRLNQYSTRPVQRLTIQRETSVGANLAQGRKGNFNRVSGNQLTVVAPAIQKSQQPVAPKQVKMKVAKPTLETGWKGINNRQQVEAEMKKGDPKNIKAPDLQPQKGRKREAVAGPQQADQNAAGQQQEAAPDANAAGQQAQDRQQQREQARQQREQARQQSEQAQQGEQRDRAAEQSEAQKNREENRKNRRGQAGEASETATPDAGQQESAQPSEETERSETQKPDREKRAEERRAQRAEQNGQEQAQPDREQGADRQKRAEERRAQRAEQSGQEQAQPDRQPGADRQRARRAQQADENQPGESARPEANRPRRGQTPEGTQSAPSTDDNSRARSQAEPRADRPERAQRQMQERRSPQEQARPQQERPEQPQGSDTPSGERKGKKNKPTEEPTPQP